MTACGISRRVAESCQAREEMCMVFFVLFCYFNIFFLAQPAADGFSWDNTMFGPVKEGLSRNDTFPCAEFNQSRICVNERPGFRELNARISILHMGIQCKEKRKKIQCNHFYLVYFPGSGAKNINMSIGININTVCMRLYKCYHKAVINLQHAQANYLFLCALLMDSFKEKHTVHDSTLHRRDTMPSVTKFLQADFFFYLRRDDSGMK